MSVRVLTSVAVYFVCVCVCVCVCVSKLPEGVSIGAVVLLDEDRCSTTLLELPLLMETPKTTLDQDGCQGHPLIKCILREKTVACYKALYNHNNNHTCDIL